MSSYASCGCTEKGVPNLRLNIGAFDVSPEDSLVFSSVLDRLLGCVEAPNEKEKDLGVAGPAAGLDAAPAEDEIEGVGVMERVDGAPREVDLCIEGEVGETEKENKNDGEVEDAETNACSVEGLPSELPRVSRGGAMQCAPLGGCDAFISHL